MSWSRISVAAIGFILLLIPFSRVALGGRPRRARFVVGAAGLVVLCAAIVGTSTPRAAIARGWLVLTGGLVDVGGYHLRLECQGTGSPTVVMDAGLDQPRTTWGGVPAAVAAFTRVCTYDRAGLGSSDSGPAPRTSQQIVAELHTLLTNAGVPHPYVLVGHSFGGINVRLYAGQHPREIVGMVLVDASHEDQYGTFATLMPAETREAYLRHEGGDNYERVDLMASADQVRGTTLPIDMPLVVLSARGGEEAADTPIARAQVQLQADLARLVPDGRQIIVKNSSHFIQLDHPSVVVDAVNTVVTSARQRSPNLSRPAQALPPSVRVSLLGGALLIAFVSAVWQRRRLMAMKRIWKKWQSFGKVVGDVVGRVLMTAFYFTVAAPFGLGIRFLSDPLRLTPAAPGWDRREVERPTLKDGKRSF